MKPHPSFESWPIPTVHILGEFTLRALSVDDVERDFAAVMESAAEIKAANPGLTWPDGLTKEKNLIDLAWHQKEFEARRSFAWVIENVARDYLGCLYVYPSIAGDKTADVTWWWRTGAVADRQRFRQHLSDWFVGSGWPALRYRLRDGE